MYVSPKYYYSTIYVSPIYSSSELSYMISIASAGRSGVGRRPCYICVRVRP